MNYTNRARFFFVLKAIHSLKNCSSFFFVSILFNFLGITTSVYSKTPQMITFPAVGEQSFLNYAQNIMADTSSGHNLNVKTDGTAWAEGFNYYGQLGNGNTNNSFYAVQIMSGVASVAAGNNHSLFLKTDGTVWATGENSFGQLGTGDTSNQSSPVYVMSGVASVAAGGSHSLFLKTDGTVWATGNNDYGQLGNGSFINQSIPVQVMSSVAAVCAGYQHSLLIKTDGTAWAFGRNNEGQLGNSSFINQSIPVKVMSDVASVYAGSGNSIFLKSDNTAWVVGDNAYGQLGDGNKGNIYKRFIPIQVMSNVVSAASGGTYSLFLKTDGTVWAAGYNGWGNFGDGSETNVTIPVQVMSGVTAVDATYGGPTNSRSLFLKNDGTVWTAGSNLSYEFGTSNILKHVIPVLRLDGIVNPKITLAATVSSGLAITYAVVSGPATLSGTTLTFTGKGIVTVSASQAGNHIYEPTTTTQTFTAGSVAQTITFPAIESRLMTSPIVSFIGAAAATSSSKLPVTYSVVDGPATLSGRALTLTGAGTVTVRASQDGNRAYEAAVSVDRTFGVSKVSQVITFPPIGNRLFSTSNIALNATAASGLPVNYSIVSGSASVSGSSLTVTAAGLITVKASQEGNSTYNSAPDVTMSFMVSPNTSPPTSIVLSKSWFYDNVAGGEIAVLSSVDPDNGDSFAYALVGGEGATDNVKFSILGDRLKGAIAYNHNTQSNFTIRVRVTDSAGQFYEQILILNLLPKYPNAKFISAGVPFTESPNYVNVFFQLVSKSTGRSISYPRSFFDPSSPDYQPDLFQVYEGATLTSATTPIGFNESYFQVGKITDVPTKIRTVILLDCSSSISISDLNVIKTAAKVMVDNMFDEQEIAVYTFSGTHTKIQDFLGKSEANQATLKAAIDTIGRGSSTTNLYGSMLAMLNLPAWVESFSTNGIETGFLVALTDGADTSGSATKEQVIVRRDLDKKRIYTIGLGAAVEPAILQELQNTNFYIPVANTTALAAAFENIQRDIIDLANSYYRINYISPKRQSSPAGTLRRMEVRLKSNGNTAADRMLSTAFNSDSFTDLAPPSMYINRSVDKVTGVDSLTVSPNIPSTASAITLFPPLDFSNFTWSIGNPSLATLTPQGTIGERVIITPNGQNGTTTLTLTDTISNTVDDYSITIPLIFGTGAPLSTQTITFPVIADKTTTSSAFTISASSSSTLPVSFSLDSGPATVTGNMVTLTGTAGTVTIRATQAGNAIFAAAEPQIRSFNVTLSPQQITFLELGNRLNTSAPFSLSASSNSGLPITYSILSGPATVSGNTVTLTGVVGTVVVRASQVGNYIYDAAPPVDQSFTVNKKSQNITFASLSSKTFGEAAFSVTASASSELPVTLSIVSGPASISGNTITLTGATGTVVVRASQAGNETYDAAPPVDQSFAVNKGSQNITFGALADKSIGDTAFAVNASANSSLPVAFSIVSGPATISGNTITLTGAAGTVVVRASQAGNETYEAAPAVDSSFEVTAVTTPLVLTNLTQTYNGTPRAISTTGGSAPVVVTYGATNSATPPTNAGTYAVKAISGGETITGSLIIAKAPLTITADDEIKLGGQNIPTLTVSYSGFLNTDNASNALTKAPTVTTTATKTSTSGNYPITAAGAISTNYSIVYVQGNMKVGSWAGKYEALLEDPATSVPVGKIEITISSTNTSFTGILTTAKQTATVSFKGVLITDLNDEIASGVSTAIIGKGETSATYNLTFELPLEGDFTTSVTRAVGLTAETDLGSSDIGKKLVFPTGKPPVAYAGDYTLIFMPDSSEDVLPRPLGFSHATAKIDSKGKLALNMKLADGTKFITSLYPDADAGYRLYFRYASRLDSYCSAWLELQEHPDLPGRGIIQVSDMQSLYWAKSASLGTKDLNYRGGIPESVCPILMDPWLPPVSAKAPNPAITLAQRLNLNSTGDMDVFHEGLPDTLGLTGLPELVRVNSAGKVEVSVTSPVNPRAWKMTLTPTTGAFTGSHTALDGSKSIPVKFSGMMRQPPSTETSPSLLGAGYSIVPQPTGQTTGTLSSAIYFTLPD